MAELLLTSIDGQPVPPEKAVVSVFDNAFLYAQGLFETFLAVDDRLVFVNDHLRRLSAGAKVIDLPIPVDRATLLRWITELLASHPARIKKLRLTVTAGTSARWLGIAGPPKIILSVASHELPVQPFSLYVSRFRVDQRSVLRRIKTISYAVQATALKEAKRFRCDDALLLNERDRVAEITSANIFWVRRGRVFTPGLDDGCLDGVTRRQVLAACRQLGVSVTEKSAPLTTVLEADELFLSSSLKLVLPISRIRTAGQTCRFPTGELTESIAQRVRRAARVD